MTHVTKKIASMIALSALALTLFAPFLTYAQTPIVPLEQIAGVPDTGVTSIDDGIGPYVRTIYIYSIGLGALFALVMIVYGGIIYMTAGANAAQSGNAKDVIKSAIFGLLLLLGAYLILFTINPALTGKSFIAPSGIDWDALEARLNNLRRRLEFGATNLDNPNVRDQGRSLAQNAIQKGQGIISYLEESMSDPSYETPELPNDPRREVIKKTQITLEQVRSAEEKIANPGELYDKIYSTIGRLPNNGFTPENDPGANRIRAAIAELEALLSELDGYNTAFDELKALQRVISNLEDIDAVNAVDKAAELKRLIDEGNTAELQNRICLPVLIEVVTEYNENNPSVNFQEYPEYWWWTDQIPPPNVDKENIIPAEIQTDIQNLFGEVAPRECNEPEIWGFPLGN